MKRWLDLSTLTSTEETEEKPDLQFAADVSRDLDKVVYFIPHTIIMPERGREQCSGMRIIWG